MRWIVLSSALLAMAGCQQMGSNAAPSAPRLVAVEPPAGQLPRGQVVLVDDGSCPSGQIKQVTGGGGNVGRERACIMRP